jgi:hypothetical protein
MTHKDNYKELPTGDQNNKLNKNNPQNSSVLENPAVAHPAKKFGPSLNTKTSVVHPAVIRQFLLKSYVLILSFLQQPGLSSVTEPSHFPTKLYMQYLCVLLA